MRYEPHTHSIFSNIRLLDSINSPEQLIDKAIELGMCGIALTDHECVSGAPRFLKHYEQYKEEYPESSFKVAIGDEIYLTPNRESNQKYYHFLLNAKNAKGWRALKELSSHAWMLSYYDRGMERVPTTYDELAAIVKKYPDSLIATSACIGGELSSTVLELCEAELTGNILGVEQAHNHIVNFVLWAKELFQNNFFIEIAPGCSKEQIMVNKRLKAIANAFDVKMIIGSDAHYLTKKDRYVHESYLNSKNGEREVAQFYEYAYLQSDEEIIENLAQSGYTQEFVEQLFQNSIEIYNSIEMYNIWHNQTIPSVEIKEYAKTNIDIKYPTLKEMFNSDDKYNRYWVNECCKKLEETNRSNDIYLSRLEEEAITKKIISNKLGTNIFKYPIVLQHYIDAIWNLGSMVGAGRGSSCSGLNHYLLGVTQLDPIKWDLPWFRYLNESRVELPDIDIDICPSKKPEVLKYIKKEREVYFNDDVDELSRKNLGCVMVATFGTETSKSAIQTACRGYRTKDYPDGIDNDIAQYLSSLIPQERGFVWTLHDAYYGNPEKDRKPVHTFVNEVNNYPGLLEIMLGIEGIIKQRGSHASGIILNDTDPYEFMAYMKTPSGDIITQFDLHTAEAMGVTKYDLLVTEVQDKLTECIKLMQQDNILPADLSLREVYNKYFHPEIMDIEDSNVWSAIQQNKVLNVFQFDSDVGAQAAKKIKPSNMRELADSNGLMRLMAAEKGAETPMDKYIRYKNNISLWYQEMEDFGLSKSEQKILEPYFLSSYGVPPSQEQLMLMLMDENICNFDISEANKARKIVGKKLIKEVPALHQKVLDRAPNKKFGEYVWKYGLGPQMSYSFSVIHALAYSFIGYQTAYIATNWNPIYWNTACLIVNSGALDPENEKSADYAKVAKALGDIISRDIKVSLIDINKSSYGFKPDVENNEILFGMKALSNINAATVQAIEEGRPYTGIKDFMSRVAINKSAMLMLIKSGAFDKLDYEWARQFGCHPRQAIMAYYISIASEPKSRLTLQNFNGLMQRGLLPESLDFQKKVFAFNKHLKAHCKIGQYYQFGAIEEQFYSRFFPMENLDVINGITCILQSVWEKIYKAEMQTAKEYLTNNQNEILKEFNAILFKDMWKKYAAGSTSAWEMESLCFYHGPHELAEVDTQKYGIVDFSSLSVEPEVDYFFRRGGRQIPIFKLTKIIGTVIAKNDARSSVSILTTKNEVVNVKFTRDYYAMFGKQISEKQDDGHKKVIEKSWFTRGTKIMVTGFRRDDMFVAKTYKSTATHQLYKILNVKSNGELELTHDRYIPVEDEE